jgi:hypothetical protein
MRKPRRWPAYGALVTAAMLFAAQSHADDTMRCRNGRLINTGMTAAEITARCGEPRSRVVEEIPIRARLPTGAVVQTGTTQAERWVYARGQGQFDAQLTFEGGKLVRIDVITEP